ncbi:DUF485 domain-containing protein [Streptomyces sp. HUAS ZL42]|uniref:DUF485 domain-containing protein n=1 Tax=Streptomyces sp. HUAS ZL42 TaxID=3231715 RepID=UPI00345EB7C3
MDSRTRFPDQDPPAAAALYLSALDHERPYSTAELRHAVSRTFTAVTQPAALLDLYQRSVQGAHTAAELEVRARRRSWALHMARHLALNDDRPLAAAAARPAWEESVTAFSEPPPRMHATSPSDQAGPGHSPATSRTTTLRELRAARRRPAEVAAAVVGAQMAGVVAANEAPGLLAVSWAGPLNIGLTLVLVQLVITGLAVLWHTRYARNSLDPMAERHSTSFAQLESHR